MNTRNIELGRKREFTHNPRYNDDIIYYPKRTIKEENEVHGSPSKVSKRADVNSDNYGYGEEKLRNVIISDAVITSVYNPKVQELKVGTMVQGKRQDVMLQYGIISEITGTGRTAKYLVRFRTSKKKVLLSHSDFWLVLPEDYWVDSGSDDEKADGSIYVASKAVQPISRESIFQRISNAILKHGNITVNKLNHLQLDEDSTSSYMPIILSDRVEVSASTANTIGVFAKVNLYGVDLQLDELIGLRGQKITQQEATECPSICDVRRIDNKDVHTYYRLCGSIAMMRHRCYNHANCYTKDWVLVYTKCKIRKGEELGICFVETPDMQMQCDLCNSFN